jgi:protoheme IX farnesyltransferase
VLRTFLELTKSRIAGLSTLSAATGYLAFTSVLRPGVLTSSAGLLLLALGACALNEWQDRDFDARMERTRRRPLPAGELSAGAALAVAGALISLGTVLLWTLHGLVPTALGLAAVAWYNGFYTYLKRLSAFAAVPGAIVGAIPPAVGWTAAGGRATDPQILALCFFFFLWQVPHFWLLLFAYGRDYEDAGLPSLTRVFAAEELARLTFVWTLVTAGASLLLRVFGVVNSPVAIVALVLAGAAMALGALLLLRGGGDRASLRRAFAGINLYALAVMGIVVADAVVFY